MFGCSHFRSKFVFFSINKSLNGNQMQLQSRLKSHTALAPSSDRKEHYSVQKCVALNIKAAIINNFTLTMGQMTNEIYLQFPSPLSFSVSFSSLFLFSGPQLYSFVSLSQLSSERFSAAAAAGSCF